MSKPFKDITGQKFGMLTALYRLHNIKNRTKWLCICECGNLKEVTENSLERDNTKSCGCLSKQGNNKTHGKKGTRIYNTWQKLKYRCYNKNDKRYHNYGGRGIKVCDEWLHDFQAFYDWAILNGYDDTLTIDRIDVNGNYEPSNCRWATPKQQSRNRTNNRNYTINGETHCLSEWCEILGLKYTTIRARLNMYHWTIEKALELEV